MEEKMLNSIAPVSFALMSGLISVVVGLIIGLI